MADLCREFGISRKTGYKLQERFERLGAAGLEDQSRRPHRAARQTSEAVADLLVRARKAHPSWGPRKLRVWLEKRHPGVLLPSASTIGDLLSRRGLVQPRRRRPGIYPYPERLRQVEAPNQVWCIDYKGQFRLGNGQYCYPLTVSDKFSRYLFACDGFEHIETEEARAVLEELFMQYGLPEAIRSDNGPPFASKGLFGLSRLSAWWLKLGIVAERIEPSHPEQNGRHERMHRTLKAETTRPAANTLLQQQERFDEFVYRYNHERPHEALGQRPPKEVYEPSRRVMSKPSIVLEYPLHDDVRRVDRGGHVQILRRRNASVFLTAALAGEHVGLRELDEDVWLLSYANLDLGWVDLGTMCFHRADQQDLPERFRNEDLPSSDSNKEPEPKVLPMSPV